ncbi:hypothetical protein [Brucella pecoris]|uniref:Uncharacterized protein n=1 Tax=Brucella pecoris TaxID=867683 RepID=A0A5C5CCW6_9HYPH|nr:hypothetical protein [Brucella pecoris]MBB4095823.1 hypothetical protein [Brucella pecoris]TNV09157.1 hypothetical protein FIB18_21495 [Brucella pecoris]
MTSDIGKPPLSVAQDHEVGESLISASLRHCTAATTCSGDPAIHSPRSATVWPAGSSPSRRQLFSAEQARPSTIRTSDEGD